MINIIVYAGFVPVFIYNICRYAAFYNKEYFFLRTFKQATAEYPAVSKKGMIFVIRTDIVNFFYNFLLGLSEPFF
ncbi:MAG: hypothetical protein D3924_05340 [Candidatus Electrothrix sp. AR4]|nr:hypothetical protein [Candidatus Electrothrix sp. AR4]